MNLSPNGKRSLYSPARLSTGRPANKTWCSVDRAVETAAFLCCCWWATPRFVPKLWNISKYRGVEEGHLLRWFVDFDDAIRARHIVDEEMKVAFTHYNLAECAKTWALGLELQDQHVWVIASVQVPAQKNV